MTLKGKKTKNRKFNKPMGLFFMNPQILLTVSIFVITSLTSVLSLLFSKPDDEQSPWDQGTIRSNFKISKWLFVIIVVLNIGSLVSSILLLQKQQNEKDKENDQKKSDLAIQQKHYDTTLLRIDAANYTLNRTLNSVQKVQDTLSLISDTVHSQLVQERKISDVTQNLLGKNKKVLKFQSELLKNTDLANNPFSPVDITCEFTMPMSSDVMTLFVPLWLETKKELEDIDLEFRPRSENGLEIKYENNSVTNNIDELEFRNVGAEHWKPLFFNLAAMAFKIELFKVTELNNSNKPCIGTYLFFGDKEVETVVSLKFKDSVVSFLVKYDNCQLHGLDGGYSTALNQKDIFQYTLSFCSVYENSKLEYNLKTISFYSKSGIHTKLKVRFSENDVSKNKSKKYMHNFSMLDYNNE